MPQSEHSQDSSTQMDKMRRSSHRTPRGHPAPFWNCLCPDQVRAFPSAMRYPRALWSGHQGVHHGGTGAAPSISVSGHVCHTGLFLLGDTRNGFYAQVVRFGGFGQAVSQTGDPGCLFLAVHKPPPCRMTGLAHVPQEAGAPLPADLLVESPKGAQGPRVDHKAELRQRKGS